MAGNDQTQPQPGTATHPVADGRGGDGRPTAQVDWWAADAPGRREAAERAASEGPGTPQAAAGGGWPSPWDRAARESMPAQGAPEHGSMDDTIRYSDIPGGPGQGGGDAFATSPAPAPRRHRWLEMAIAAMVAAVVAAGTTVGVLATDDTAPTSQATTSSSSSAAGTGHGPVTQASGRPVDWTAVAKAVEPSVVAISVSSQFGGGEGSGVVLDDKGHVLTNNHVVAAGGTGGTLSVTLNDGRTYGATIVGTDPSTDLAVVQMKGADNLTPATLGDSDAIQVGEPVMAVGNPLGLAGTVTTGIVSALDRPVTTSTEQGNGPASSSASPVVTNAIQTDAAVNPGNSGGALVDSSGRVIGVPSSIASLGSSFGGQSGSIGLGFSIPVNEAKSIADQLIAHGKAEHPLLGVTLKDGSIKDGSATRTAAVVVDVSGGTPAATAGLRSDDAIIKVDDELVNGSESLVAQIRERNVGSRVSLTIMRGGKEQTVQVTLASRSSD
jgi:putative serine protease PepD